MNIKDQQQQLTRQAITNSLAELIAESGAEGFSVQAVADRAGVSHRTVYNHFPTRKALLDGLAAQVEEELRQISKQADHERLRNVDDLLGSAQVFSLFEQIAPQVRASVLISVLDGAPSKVASDRTTQIEQLIECELGPLPTGVAKLVTAAIRMVLSTTAWHLLTSHQGLTTDEAIRTSEWVMRTLVNGVKCGDLPRGEDAR